MSDNRPTRFTQTPRPPKLLDQVRQGIRLKHMSSRTEDSYVHYIRQFILFHNKRHPKDMGVEEIRAFLIHLAVDRHVAASTQNVARSALLFLYREVLHMDLPNIGDVPRAQRPRRMPVVFSRLTPSATASPPISWRTATTFVRYRNYWATRTSKPP